MDVDSGIDLEQELADILQREIWKEITLETGYTKEQLDEETIKKLVAIKQLTGCITL